MADQIARGIGRPHHGHRGRRQQPGDFRERAVEALHHAIVLNAHLHGERPTRDVVGTLGRAAGISEIVGMILRLEHVHHVRAERLRGLHHIGTRGIALAGHLESGGRALPHGDAVLQQRVDKFRGGGEVGLIGRNDVAARIAQFGIVQNRVVQLRRNRARGAPKSAAAGGHIAARRRSRCRAAPASTTPPRPPPAPASQAQPMRQPLPAPRCVSASQSNGRCCRSGSSSSPSARY